MITLSTILTTAVFKSLLIVAASIFLDFFLGVLISIKKKTFSLSLLPQTIATNFFPYMCGLIVLALLSVYLSELEYLYYAFALATTAKFSKEALLDKVKVLFA